MQFYEFSQNNSGGSFVVNEKICHRLFIEAESDYEANQKAEELGCYWDGCSDGRDCNCCGDRWSKTYGYANLEKFKTEGYEVSIYSHYDNAEQRWEDKYRKYIVLEEPRWTEKWSRRYQGKITFRDIEDYAQFLADEYGWTTPDARVYYADGRVKEICKTEK